MCIERPWAARIVPAMEKWIALVKAKMRELDITQEKLAERVGVTQGAVGHWLRRERQPKLDMMNAVLEALGMPHLQVRLHIVPHGEHIAEQVTAYGTGADETLSALGDPTGFRYPVLAWLELDGERSTDSLVHQLSDYQAHGKAFWLRVESDAMNAPSGLSVPEGMLILVDPGVPAAPGRLIIARQPGVGTVFRQWVEEGGLRYLRPLNPMYPTVACDPALEILGVVMRAHARF
ncbi:LexA family protein [Pseudomonas alabamensis]|uniref:LexA family protein n=1 Tax=Pseudomonas alabamensis TaxID=3064349 RepID=UPI000745CD56|nr:Cro/Cl family transcriptional regulator [Pseudomonas monteilii]